MNEYAAALSFFQEQYECARTASEPPATVVELLHDALAIRTEELKRIQTAIDNGIEVSQPLCTLESFGSGSTSEALDEASFRQFMVAQARRAAPWFRTLRTCMEAELKENISGHESVIEIIKTTIQEPEVKDFALSVARELEVLNIKVLGGKCWIYATFPDGCSAFWLACPVSSPTEDWATYGLIDLSEAGGKIPSRVKLFASPAGGIELMAILFSVFERRNFHRSQ